MNKIALRYLTLILLLGLILPGCTKIPNQKQNTDNTGGESQTVTTKKKDNPLDTSAVISEEVAIPVSDPYVPLNYTDFKAMWLSQFDMQSVYTKDGRQRDEASFTSLAKTILSNIKEQGINTVIVQVRPNADSMYPSNYYPMSAYTVGSYGRTADYDPFAIILKEAHAIGLSVQAWINPMRAMSDSQISLVGKEYQIKQWYTDTAKKGTYIVQVGSNWYLNPAYPEVRKLIVDGAKEILEKYDVDGLHMDDYFYPTTETSFDSAAYSGYVKSGGKSSLADWRREQLNLLVKELYQAVKEYSPDALFGISPAGNFETVYERQYADVYEWCGKPGYIDYICPQAYFGFEHATFDFVKVVTTYQSMIKPGSGVKLIVGMSLGKAVSGYSGTGDQYAGTGKDEWIKNRDILYRQLEYTKKLDKCTGVSYFCYQYFYDPVKGTTIKASSDERSLFVPLLKTITWVK